MKRHQDKGVLKFFRRRCEWQPCKNQGVGHHLSSRGAGGPDLEFNLLTLCAQHHAMAHSGEITRADLLALVAAREGMLQDDIAARIHLLRRAPKGCKICGFCRARGFVPNYNTRTPDGPQKTTCPHCAGVGVLSPHGLPYREEPRKFA